METSGSCINASAEAAGTERDIRVLFTVLLFFCDETRERDAKSERKEKRECTP